MSVAFASGWMAMRGTRRRRAADKGFILSDHADWDGLYQAIQATGAEQVFVTHGYTDTYTRWLRDQGYDAHVVSTEYTGEDLDAVEASPAA
jgi:putative mRNA 3-end processing factor